MKRGELKRQIVFILDHFPKSRDSDQWLTLKLWCVFYASRIKRFETTEEGKQGTPYILLRDILDLPREDHVKRIRAIIQNEEKRYLPTSLDVAKKRDINEEDWKEYIRVQTEFKRI